MTNDKKRYGLVWHMGVDRFLNKEIMEDVLRFNSKTTLTIDSANKKPYFPSAVEEFIAENQKKTIKFSDHEEEIMLHKDARANSISSCSYFNKDAEISFLELSNIIVQSFGASKETRHRPYPSGGALFTVFPILLVFNTSKIKELEKTGAYFYDCFENKLCLLKEWKDTKCAESIFAPLEDIPSDMAIVYCVDIRKVLLKYGYLGYNHIYLETGMMAQSLRKCLYENCEMWGELCYSSYNGNGAKKVLGFNQRLVITTLVQWFGIRG